MGRIIDQIMQQFTFIRLIGRGGMVVVHRPATWIGEAVVDTSTSPRNVAHFQDRSVKSKT